MPLPKSAPRQSRNLPRGWCRGRDWTSCRGNGTPARPSSLLGCAAPLPVRKDDRTPPATSAAQTLRRCPGRRSRRQSPPPAGNALSSPKPDCRRTKTPSDSPTFSSDEAAMSRGIPARNPDFHSAPYPRRKRPSGGSSETAGRSAPPTGNCPSPPYGVSSARLRCLPSTANGSTRRQRAPARALPPREKRCERAFRSAPPPPPAERGAGDHRPASPSASPAP